MLCDDLVADELLPIAYDGLDRTYDKIRQAQKFILSPQFAIAADGLVDNIPELFKIAPWCRVPFPLTWIEWLASDRPHWDQNGPYKARPVDRSRFQFAPHRIGILLEQQGRASCWKTHLFWSMRTAETGQYNGSIAALRFDAEACDNADDPLIAATRTVMADFGRRMLMKLLKTDPDVVGKLSQYALEDWGGEMRYMVSVLGLLNTRNVTESTSINNDKMNAKRQRHGKRPLFSHNILKIRPSICTGGTAAQTAGGHRDIRFHYVRGHFKQRASGLYWWSMHGRGRVDVGVVEKDYEVEA